MLKRGGQDKLWEIPKDVKQVYDTSYNEYYECKAADKYYYYQNRHYQNIKFKSIFEKDVNIIKLSQR